MPKPYQALISSLIVLLSMHLAHAQQQISLLPEDEALLDSLCEAHQVETKIPGIAIGIVSKGKILYAKGFGVRSVDSGRPVTITSVFHLASISKTFVATGVAQLVAEGKIRLEDPVTTYLPYFEMANPRYKDITIKHLLTHSPVHQVLRQYG